MSRFALPLGAHRDRALQGAAPSDTLGEGDSGLVVVGELLWLTALVRVLLALQSHEVFGADASLAVVAILVLPWLVFERLREKGGSAHQG